MGSVCFEGLWLLLCGEVLAEEFGGVVGDSAGVFVGGLLVLMYFPPVDVHDLSELFLVDVDVDLLDVLVDIQADCSELALGGFGLALLFLDLQDGLLSLLFVLFELFVVLFIDFSYGLGSFLLDLFLIDSICPFYDSSLVFYHIDFCL